MSFTVMVAHVVVCRKLGSPETFQPWIQLAVPRKVDAALEDVSNLSLSHYLPN